MKYQMCRNHLPTRQHHAYPHLLSDVENVTIFKICDLLLLPLPPNSPSREYGDDVSPDDALPCCIVSLFDNPFPGIEISV